MNVARKPAARESGHAASVLILCSSENDARKLESHLRNAGHNVRARWISWSVGQELLPEFAIAAITRMIPYRISRARKTVPMMPMIQPAVAMP